MNVIITGATKGIGLAIAENFAVRSFNMCLCSRNLEDLTETRENLLSLNPAIEVFIKKTDMSKKEQVYEFGDYCLNKFQKIDALINNAGVFIPGLIHQEEDGALEKMIETNLYSVYHLTRKLVHRMIENRSGYIVNMSSIAGFMAYPNGGSYSISKFALSGFSKVLREELKDQGIKVTTVMPGATWSNSWQGADLPLDRLIQASDIAVAVGSLFDMSPSAVVEELVIRPQLGDL